MDNELGCDFYLGDALNEQIKSMDYNSLYGYKRTLKNLTLFGNYFWQIGTLSVLFKPYRSYIIDGEPYNISNWFLLFFGRLLGKKVYTWTHGWYGRESVLKRHIKKLFFKMAHHNFLYGDYAKNLMIAEGFKENKLSCIYNSLDYDTQLKFRNEATSTSIYINHFNNSFNNLFFLGRLTESKKLDMLIHALADLNNKSIFFNLTLIGAGDANNDLHSLVKDLGLTERVWFYGACYNEIELSELIYNADLCVSPGNVGLTAIHSLMYGTPVLTHNFFPNQGPEFEAIAERETGLFYEYNNITSLADCIVEWMNIQNDRKLIQQKCFEMIDDRYNPHFQIGILKKILLSS
jgi:glycosyltransferase involved in cell wall biosynthesis